MNEQCMKDIHQGVAVRCSGSRSRWIGAFDAGVFEYGITRDGVNPSGRILCVKLEHAFI